MQPAHKRAIPCHGCKFLGSIDGVDLYDHHDGKWDRPGYVIIRSSIDKGLAISVAEGDAMLRRLKGGE